MSTGIKNLQKMMHTYYIAWWHLSLLLLLLYKYHYTSAWYDICNHICQKLSREIRMLQLTDCVWHLFLRSIKQADSSRRCVIHYSLTNCPLNIDRITSSINKVTGNQISSCQLPLHNHIYYDTTIMYYLFHMKIVTRVHEEVKQHREWKL